MQIQSPNKKFSRRTFLHASTGFIGIAALAACGSPAAAPAGGNQTGALANATIEFLPKYGHVLYQPVGWSQASDIVNPAMAKIWVGSTTAEKAMADAVLAANNVLQTAQAKKS